MKAQSVDTGEPLVSTKARQDIEIIILNNIKAGISIISTSGATAANQAAELALLAQIAAHQPGTQYIDSHLSSFSTDVDARRIAEKTLIQNMIEAVNTMLATDSENSQRMGFELR